MLQTFTDFFALVEQCCDASYYLELGQRCAESGDCYDRIRPMGAVYWFSIPFRLGGSPAAMLITAHIFLALLSVSLSVVAIKKLLRSRLPSISRLAGPIIFIASACVHVIFLYPVFRVSLSDTPASLLLLIVLWLLLIRCAKAAPDFVSCALIALCLGLVAWIRVFFLYPVLAVIFAGFFILWRQRKTSAPALLLVFLPVFIQCFVTWSYTGSFSYLDPHTSRSMTYFHLHDKRIGYDTVLPYNRGYDWFSSCKHNASIMDALEAGDRHALACVIGGRLDFYLGSYATRVYPLEKENDRMNKPCLSTSNRYASWSENLLPSYSDSISTEGMWHTVNMQRTEKAGIGLDQTKTAVLLSKPRPGAYGEISQKIFLESSSCHYEFSSWLWSAADASPVIMGVRYADSQKTVAEKNIRATPLREVKTLGDINITESGYYDLYIASPATAVPANLFLWEDLNLRKFFPVKPAAVAAQIRTADFEKVSGDFRLWSRWILLANVAACFGAILFFVTLRKQLQPLQWLVPWLLILSFAMALLIIPEQRFVIVPIIAAWIFSFAFLVIITAPNPRQPGKTFSS